MSRVLGKSFSNAVIEVGAERHIPCPKLFALRNGYQLDDIRLAWDLFMDKGYGHCIPYRRLRTLWEEVVECCDEERASWTFTRDNRWKPIIGRSAEENEKEESIDDDIDRENESTKWEPSNSKF